MLIDPASKASVPLTVVIRTLSRVLDKESLPPEEFIDAVPNALRPNTPDSTQVLPVILQIVKEPSYTATAALSAVTKNPDAIAVTTVAAAFTTVLAVPAYPVVVKDPEPI
jgi:hypothetical protein